MKHGRSTDGILLLVALFSLAPLAAETSATDAATMKDLRGVVQCEFNHDASRVLSRTRGGDIGLWDVASGAPIAEELTRLTNATCLIVSPDHRRVLLGRAESARVFDATSGATISPAWPVRMQPEVKKAAALSPRGDQAVIFEEKHASIWNVESGAQIKKISLRAGPYEEASPDAIFTQAGDACFLMDPDGTVTRYQTKDWAKRGKPMRHPRSEFSYDFACNASADGQWLATFDSAGENGPKCSLQIWNAKTGQPLGKPYVGVNGFVGYFAPRANRIVLSPARGEGEIRDLPSLKVAGRLTGFDDLSGPPVVLSPDGKWILSWDSTGTLNLLEATTGKMGASIKGTADISAVFVAPDSAAIYVLYDSPDGSAEQYSDNQITRLTLPDMKITGSIRALEITQDISISPDGNRLLLRFGTPDAEQIMLVDTATMNPLP